jgi:hypothetical protein
VIVKDVKLNPGVIDHWQLSFPPLFGPELFGAAQATVAFAAPGPDAT